MSEAKQSQAKIYHVDAGYKMVDTCAGEFNAETPYFYAGYDSENEAEQFLQERRGGVTGAQAPVEGVAEDRGAGWSEGKAFPSFI